MSPTEPTPPTGARRKRLGAWYTPEALVEAVVQHTVFEGARTALDPACGDGRFLRATGLQHQVGMDLDPVAAADGGFVHGDALQHEWGDQRFDVVVGNPPFLNQLAAATTRGGRSRFGGGPYADAAAEFLSLAVRLVRPGGRVGLVLPQSLLAARDASAIRTEVDRVAALRWMWWSPSHWFDASVRVWAGVWEVGGAPGEVQRAYGDAFDVLAPVVMPSSWSGLIAAVPTPVRGDGPTLGSIATFTSDFRDQYYGLVGAVSDTATGPPLVTSGLIEPGQCLWGSRPVRFAKQRFTAPRVDLRALSPDMQTWASRRLVPKILIANQTRVIEAVHDRNGEWLPGVPVITCVTEHPDHVMRVLQSAAANEWAHYHAAGSGLSATSVRLTPGLLASIPLA